MSKRCGLAGLDVKMAGTNLANMLVSLSPPEEAPGALVIPVMAEAMGAMLAQVDDAECDRIMRAFINQVAMRRETARRRSPILRAGGLN